MVNSNFPVPERIPGQLITDPQHAFYLKQHLTNLCGLRGSQRFPGSQPVSFTQQSLKLLETENFWVCEKSDGVRVMVLIVVKFTPQGPVQEVYFIDRKDDFYLVENIVFPHFEHHNRLLKDTILDGELVIDVDPKTGQHQLRFLTFDCIVWEGDNLMQRPLMNRYGRLKDWVITPLKKLMQLQPQIQQNMPFDVKLKPMELAYGLEKVLHHDLPRLTHGNDGLIFTSATAPYRIGTDPRMLSARNFLFDNVRLTRMYFIRLKWKPPSENSIDFRLELRFPPRADDPNEADFYAKPLFVLMMHCGKEGDRFFDTLEMSDEEWMERKKKREQLDNRVVEVVWDAPRQTWKILRFRDDKRNGNYRDVVYSILDSIRDGVEAEELSKYSATIRKAWKARAEGSNSKSSGSKSPTHVRQSYDGKQSPSASNSPNWRQRSSKSKSPPAQAPKQPHAAPNLPKPAPSNVKAAPGTAKTTPGTVPINLIGGNPKTKGKKKTYTIAQVGTVAATVRRI